MDKLLVWLKLNGVDVGVLLAGLSGAVSSLRKYPQLSWWERFLTFISGTACAVYITPIFGYYFELCCDALYGVSFLLGLGGLKFAEMLLEVIHGGLRFKLNK